MLMGQIKGLVYTLEAQNVQIDNRLKKLNMVTTDPQHPNIEYETSNTIDAKAWYIQRITGITGNVDTSIVLIEHIDQYILLGGSIIKKDTTEEYPLSAGMTNYDTDIPHPLCYDRSTQKVRLYIGNPLFALQQFTIYLQYTKI